MKKSLCVLLAVILLMFTVTAVSTTYAENILFGDVNNDGKIDTVDLIMLRKWLVHDGSVTNKDINRKNANVSGWPEDEITIADANRIANYLAKVITDLTPRAYTTIASDAQTYTISELSDCLTLCGRAEFGDENASILLSQTASGFKFTAVCHGNLVINCSRLDKNCKFSVAVDGDYDNQVLADGVAGGYSAYAQTELEEGTHTIEIRKATEWSQCPLVTVSSVTVCGEKGTEKPTEKTKKIEFYGDSITSCYGILTTAGTKNAGSWEYQDGTATYAAFTAHNYDAEYAVASASGHGVLGGYNDTTSLYSKYFDYAIVPNKTPWSVADYDADLIVINFGSNDDSRTKNAGTTVDIDAFVEKASEIVEGMHEKNADAKILWVIGMNYVADSGNVVTALNTLASKYSYVDFYKMSAAALGGDYHPTIAEHKTHAKRLCEYIDAHYPNLFK
ncbi:MAG: hypothetical protein IJO19_01400 [Clostridia bacterium]|nr:hypothetical protein [Clostridia bacterium]